MTRNDWKLLALAIGLGCSGADDDKASPPADPDTTDGDTDTDADGDTDADSDTDADTDADADSDVDTAVAPIAGRWSGRCNPTSTATTTTYDDYPYIDLSLDITESAGTVSGNSVMSYPFVAYYGSTGGSGGGTSSGTTVVPLETTGTWDGTTAILVFGYLSYGVIHPFPLELTVTVGTDALVGELQIYPGGTSGYPTLPFDCTLDRL